MRRLVFATVVALAAVLIGCDLANAAAPRQVWSFSLTSTVPRTATGMVLGVDFQNPNDPNAQPPAVAQMVVHSPGVVLDTNVPPQCHASDAQLMVEGPSGCPAGSKVGSGTAVTDSGPSGSFPRYSTATITDFNTNGGIIGVGVSNDISAIKTVDHTTFGHDSSTTNFPLLIGLPPFHPLIALKSLHETFPTYVRNGHTYAETPPTCPAVGYWTFTATFTYHDGITETATSHSPCSKR